MGPVLLAFNLVLTICRSQFPMFGKCDPPDLHLEKQPPGIRLYMDRAQIGVKQTPGSSDRMHILDYIF